MMMSLHHPNVLTLIGAVTQVRQEKRRRKETEKENREREQRKRTERERRKEGHYVTMQ